MEIRLSTTGMLKIFKRLWDFCGQIYIAKGERVVHISPLHFHVILSTSDMLYDRNWSWRIWYIFLLISILYYKKSLRAKQLIFYCTHLVWGHTIYSKIKGRWNVVFTVGPINYVKKTHTKNDLFSFDPVSNLDTVSFNLVDFCFIRISWKSLISIFKKR